MSPRGGVAAGARARVAVGVVVLALAASGCAAQADHLRRNDPCAALEQFQEARQAVRDLDPETVTPEAAEAALADLAAATQRLTATADGSMRQDVATLRLATADLRATIVAAGPEAFTTARPIVADQINDVRAAAATLERSVGAGCVAG